jgi:ABC-type Fe3+-hydroxamate transport system substrate-binding protein
MNVIRAGLALVLVWLAILPGRPARAQDSTPEPFPRRVIDHSGAVVVIPVRPQQVAVLGHVPPLGVLLTPPEIVALDPDAPDDPPHWEEADLLVVPEANAALHADRVAQVRAAGIPIFQTGPITSLADWRAALATLGDATGRESEAAAAAARLDRRLDAVADRVSGRAAVRVLVLTPEGYTFGQDTLITELIALAGGINAAAQAGFDDFRQIDDIAIHELAPDVILLTPAWSDDDAADFAASRAYDGVPAHISGRIVRLPFSPTLVPDPAAAVVALALVFHPAALLFP